METVKNLSIRKTILLYMVITLLISYLLGFAVMQAAEREQRKIWFKYMGEEYRSMIEEIGSQSSETQAPPIQEPAPQEIASIERPVLGEMTDSDRMISEICDFLQTYSILIISFVGTICAVFLFYKNKLQVPLAKLTKAACAIENNNLDFILSYEKKDEMGQLCKEFERMRRQLAENNERMWKMVEQEKALRASIAHDIRSPLSILKGYQEMLLEQNLSDEKFLVENPEKEMLEEGMAQIKRIEDFLDTMRKMSALEERSICLREVKLSELTKRYQKNMGILAEGSGKECRITLKTEQETIKLDEEIVTEVLENLLTNALRYAKKTVSVLLTTENGEFRMKVQDDGEGFTEDAAVLTRIYYHANPQDDLAHFGMGLYICRLYCEKHGGRLLLGNRPGGGGEAVAIFAVEDKKDRAD